MKKERTTILLMGSLAGVLNEEEQVEFNKWLEESEDNRLLAKELSEEGLAEAFFEYRRINTAIGLSKVKAYIYRQKHFLHIGIAYGVIAASIVGVVILAALFFQLERINSNTILAPVDVYRLPQRSYPTLITSDGAEYRLDDSNLRSLSDQLDLQVTRAGERHLIYSHKTGKAHRHKYSLYNTINIPFGRPWKISFPDGTTIWVNAGSALSYPITSGQGERVVALKGESFFDVVEIQEQGRKRPFIVRTDETQINVTGTRFNVRAYFGDPEVHTTLLKGQVSVVNNNRETTLKPGQSAILDRGQKRLTVKQVDTTLINGWTAGVISFDGGKIKDVMASIGRAYGFTPVYGNGIDTTHYVFIGSISTAMPREQVLEQLERTFHITTIQKHPFLFIHPKDE